MEKVKMVQPALKKLRDESLQIRVAKLSCVFSSMLSPWNSLRPREVYAYAKPARTAEVAYAGDSLQKVPTQRLREAYADRKGCPPRGPCCLRKDARSHVCELRPET